MNTDKPQLVLFGAHRWKREDVIGFAQQAGFEPVLVLFQSEDISVEAERLGGVGLSVLRLSYTSSDAIHSLADQLSKSRNDWVALGLDDYVCEIAAELSRYSTRGPLISKAGAHIALHKHLLREKWNNLADGDAKRLFPVPFKLLQFDDVTFRSLSRIEESQHPLGNGSFIVKPDALDASIGIKSVSDQSEIDKAIEEISRELTSIFSEAKEVGIQVAPDILIERKIPRSQTLHQGAEFSAEFLSTKVGSKVEHTLIGVTQKYVDPKTFVEVAHCFPSQDFPDDLRPALIEATSSLLDELKVQFCISHWEYIVTDDNRLALVEAQLRPAGDNIMELVTLATGRNPYLALFDILRDAGNRRPPTFVPNRTAVVFFPMPVEDIRGTMSLVSDHNLDSKMRGNLQVRSDLGAAARWGTQCTWNSRFLRIISEGDSYQSARESCEKLLSELTILCSDGLSEPRRVGLRLR